MGATLLKNLPAMLVILGLCSPALAAEDRMAGGSSKATTAIVAEPVKAADAPGTLEVNYTMLESHGLLSRATDGGLGRDLWRGSKRSNLVEWLPALPGTAQYRTLQDLSRRILLSAIDAELIKNDLKPQAGQDLTTLRIEKLMDIGAYEEALTLYTRHPDAPYHERLARAGLLAAFYSQQPAIACLEAQTLQERFQKDIFWQQLDGICRYIVTKARQSKTERPDIPDSKILQKLVKDDDYRFKVRAPRDLDELTPLEVAVLTADKRLDIRNLDISHASKLPLHVITLLMNTPTLPDESRFSLTLQAVKRGAVPASSLQEFYKTQGEKLFGQDKKKTSLTDYQKLAGWKRPVYLYRAATNAAAGREQVAIMEQAFDIVQDYGTAALWPFVDIIGHLNPSDLTPEAIRTAFSVLLETGSKITPEWVESRFAQLEKSDPPKKTDLLQYAAYRIDELSTEKTRQDIDLETSSETLGQEQLKLLTVIYEKLDTGIKLHNIGDKVFYEKDGGLTSAVDYVMPLSDLMEYLESAELDKRLGEVILLSSIVLSDVPPEKMDGAVLSEVIDGLSTVGLTKEARSLAREVVLGFDNIIKGEN